MSNANEILSELRQERDFEKMLPRFISNQKLVDSFIEFCRKTEYPYPEYASWLFSHLARKHPQALYKHYFTLIDIWLASKNTTLHRNLLNTIAHLPFKPYEKKEGEFLDKLIAHLNSSETKVAVKVYCMELLEHFVNRYPEIAPELVQSIENQLPNGSAGFKSRGKKFIFKLSK